MQVIINLTPATETGESEQYAFAKDKITIGRDAACDLVLPDTKRIVSKEHAAIEVGPSGFELVDLGSKNFTFLNGQRLNADDPHPLREGDVIRIGEFELAFSVAEEDPVSRDDQTVFLINPFDAPAAQLAALLEKIDAAYRAEIPGRREEALRLALRSAMADKEAALRLVVDAVQVAEPAASGATAPPLEPERSAPARIPTKPSSASPKADGRPKGDGPRAAYPPGSAYDRVFDILIQMVPRLLGVPWRFRHEFIGQTIMHSPDAAALFEGGPEEVRRFLLDPNLTEEETERRASLLKEAVDELLMHALAMVDGYKGSVQQGLSRLLDEVDPLKVEAEVRESGKWFETLPVLMDLKVAQRTREKITALRQEDWAVAERRIYRPAFIMAYLARMTSKRRTGD